MKLLGLLAAIATATLSTVASATPLKFEISGDYSAKFVLDSTPVPDFFQDGYLFAIYGVPGFPGASSQHADIGFFNAAGTAGAAGLLIVDSGGFDYLLDAIGPQLYTGPESAPTFHKGSYALTGLSTPGDFTLTISAIPEPASWALMIIGFGLAGTAMRPRRASLDYPAI
jgi:hypothetical protein